MMSGRHRSSCVWCCDSHIFEGPENCKMLAVNIAGRNNGLIKLIVFVVRLREELVYERCVFTLILQRTTYVSAQQRARVCSFDDRVFPFCTISDSSSKIKRQFGPTTIQCLHTTLPRISTGNDAAKASLWMPSLNERSSTEDGEDDR